MHYTKNEKSCKVYLTKFNECVIVNLTLSRLNGDDGGDKVNILKQLREERGLTQEELAEKSGVSRVTISMLEVGKQKVTKSTTLVSLADALGVSVTDLLCTDC